jgi:hypothetical protein
LQANKGLVVEKGGLIAVKHSDKLLVFNTLPNGLVQNWKVGFIPPGYLYWRVSYTGILTEIQMDLGFGAQRISAANGVASISPVNALTDGGIPATNTGFVNSTTLNFQGENNLDIKDFWISPQNAGSAGPIYNSCQTFTASYSEDGINYTPLGVGTIQVSNSVATVYSPYSGTILRPAQLVKVGFST